MPRGRCPVVMVAIVVHLVGVDRRRSNCPSRWKHRPGRRKQERPKERPRAGKSQVTRIQRKSNIWHSPTCRVRGPSMVTREIAIVGIEGHRRVRHFVALYRRWSTLTRAQNNGKPDVKPPASHASPGRLDSTACNECCGAIDETAERERTASANIALEARTAPVPGCGLRTMVSTRSGALSDPPLEIKIGYLRQMPSRIRISLIDVPAGNDGLAGAQLGDRRRQCHRTLSQSAIIR